MSGSISLNGTWGLTYTEGVPFVAPERFVGRTLRGRRLLEARVPAPIHKLLVEQGLIEDPNIGMNSLKARWVEEAYWIYRHTFTAPAEATRGSAWLTFERIELDATFLLNGEKVGAHANANRPARIDVTGKLRSGENLLVIQISSGMHAAADLPAAEYEARNMELFTKRIYQRKPQYQCGWDWNARLMNVGILGDVALEWRSTPRLGQVAVFAVPNDDFSSAAVHVRADIEGIADAAVDGVLRARIAETGQEASLPVRIEKGDSRHELTLDLDKPELWWPIGHGEQSRYTVEVTLEAGRETQRVTRRTGVRRIEMDQSAHPVEGRYCILKVNGRPIFCKGGNWVPADLMYSTVTPERYRELVRLAVEANFNTLRVWGGGLFAEHPLLEACDEAGVLVWHDFLFACGKYPGDDPAFNAEVRREVVWAVRELAHHPSLAVWCGNNEIEWGDWGWGYDTRYRAHPHYFLFHHDIPKIVLEEDASKLYWISSPWSPEFKFPNDPTCGDQHPWNVSILTPGGADFWKYREFVDRFPNEGGVLGMSSPATLRQFLPEKERYVLSPSWDHHDNPFAYGAADPEQLGRAYATVELWSGRDPVEMNWEDYAFISALLQAEGLGEYIANYRRRMFSSASAIFWMYNDSWPVTHGWTIVDYYLRKKLAYHPVRRAFQPVTVVATADEKEVTIWGVNEQGAPWSGELRWGLFGLAGGRPVDERRAVSLEPNASTALARLDRSVWQRQDLKQSGAFAVLYQSDEPVAQHKLLLERFKDLAFADPKIELALKGERLTLSCDAFAWGVCLDIDGERPLADNCFDLIPGVPYALPWNKSLGEPRVLRTGNGFFGKGR
jgi:beta-mannosidase